MRQLAEYTPYDACSSPAPRRLWPGSLSGAGARYAPAVLGMPGSRRSGHAYPWRRSAVPESIAEEEVDLSLLPSAAPMGEARHHDVADQEPVFDVTSALGPMAWHDAEFIKRLQEHEARGSLTGGLGQGFALDARVRVSDSELLSSAAALQRGGLARSLTGRSTQPTICDAGQDEANRRGQVVEVVADADISCIKGPDAFYAKARPATRVFYPQPNWKPAAMRWPYLTMLVGVSVALAAAAELLYRRFGREPMLRFRSAAEVPPGVYLAAKFAPTLAAVVYGVLWQLTDHEVRRLEAFYQLSRREGALAGESLNVDYVTSANVLRPVRALRLGHWAVALSSGAALLAVSLVPSFAAAAVVLSPGRRERALDPDADKALLLSAAWTRLLSATLAACAAAGCGLLYLLQTRRSGLQADVRGIAGLAAMAVTSHMLTDFGGMDTARQREIHERLRRRRYALRNASLVPEDDEVPGHAEAPEQLRSPESPHPLMLRAAGWVPFVGGSLAFLAFIPAFALTRAHVVTDHAPWLVPALAACVKLSWNAMETAVRVMEPYYLLSRRHAPARTLTLDYSALPFGCLPVRALLNGHGLVFAVGAGSVMAEFWTVLVTGLATVDGRALVRGQPGGSGPETPVSFAVSLALAIALLVYLVAASCVVFARRRHPFLPRPPTTMASVLAYLHQSKMLYDFVGAAPLGRGAMARRLAAEGATYGLGWFEGRDGRTHCGVDREELASGYQHGVDYAQRNEPWNTQWQLF